MTQTFNVYWKISLIAGWLIWANSLVWANDSIEVIDSETHADVISDALVKMTWEAELKNNSDQAVTVTITCNLIDGDGITVHSLEIVDFTIPAKGTETAVQSRPMDSATWDEVDDHEILTE